MTERLYYTDPSCRAFDAVVTRTFEHEGRPAVTLDRSAFYPSSGGQPFDTGRLDAIPVVETVDDGADVVHILAASLMAGTRVHGEIDWPRRFDHMQQHTGQHVLSAAFDRLFDNRTIGFHMGGDLSTIDLARDMSSAERERAVDEANRVIWDDRAVTIRFVPEEEAARLPLRKEPARQGTLRLIVIDDFDVSACGGTHVARTGAIGLIAVIGAERIRGGTRLAFVCGGRALDALRVGRDAVAGCVRSLSVLPQDLPAAVERLQADGRMLRKTISRLQEALAVYEAARLVSNAPMAGGLRTVAAVMDGWDAAGLKVLASALSAHAGVAAALLSASSPAAAVIARSADGGIDARAVLRRLTERFGGRGGGKPDLAQGGGLTGDPQAIASAARELLAGRP